MITTDTERAEQRTQPGTCNPNAQTVDMPPAPRSRGQAVTIKLSSIIDKNGTQMRAGMDGEIVREYAEKYKRGEAMPPIDVFLLAPDDTQYLLADGFYRLSARLTMGAQDIEANIHTGTRADAIALAFSNNRKHGKRFDEKDLPRCVAIALETFPGYSQEQIAELVGCAQGTVSKLLAGDVIPGNNASRPPVRPDSKGRMQPTRKPRKSKAAAVNLVEASAPEAPAVDPGRVYAALKAGEQLAEKPGVTLDPLRLRGCIMSLPMHPDCMQTMLDCLALETMRAAKAISLCGTSSGARASALTHLDSAQALPAAVPPAAAAPDFAAWLAERTGEECYAIDRLWGGNLWLALLCLAPILNAIDPEQHEALREQISAKAEGVAA